MTSLLPRLRARVYGKRPYFCHLQRRSEFVLYRGLFGTTYTGRTISAKIESGGLFRILQDGGRKWQLKKQILPAFSSAIAITPRLMKQGS